MLEMLLNEFGDGLQAENDLFQAYFKTVLNGPMADYRLIRQSGGKGGQSYFAHVLDGVSTIHTLRTSGVLTLDDLEEKLVFAAYTIHDINKLPWYSGGRDSKKSYVDVATRENIQAELKRLRFKRFFEEYEDYLEDIRLLMLFHQYQGAPLEDLNLNHHNYKLRYRRLEDLGTILLYSVDNLDLSHDLSVNNHLQIFLEKINSLSGRRWRWIIHRLGENRGVFTNIAHNTVVTYLKKRHQQDGKTVLVDLLYYPDGVAYLLPQNERWDWTDEDALNVSQALAQALVEKQNLNLNQFINATQLGIRVSRAAIEGGASHRDLLYAIRSRVDRKKYTQIWLDTYNQKLTSDLTTAAALPDETISTPAKALLAISPIMPLNQELLQRGELIMAYRNLLHEHLGHLLTRRSEQNAWTYLYRLLGLPPEKDVLYEQVDHYRRHYFVSLDCSLSLDQLFELCLSDIATLVGEHKPVEIDSRDFYEYLATHLEFQGNQIPRDFKANLQRYQKDLNKQCCMCSSTSPSVKLMDADVPEHLGVQVFSNRMNGGGGEPKRNVCPICRVQLILERLTRMSFKKNSSDYTNFYLHLYPYSFFPKLYLNALYTTLKEMVGTEHSCFILKRDRYYRDWNARLDAQLQVKMDRQIATVSEQVSSERAEQPTVVNGISVPPFSEAVSNTPTLPLNAPGENYTNQFLFGLTHALMIADFFGCRVSLSRTPFPLLSNDYMTDHQLAFFVDSVPLNTRWLLPVNEYRSLETYRKKEKGGGAEFQAHATSWAQEPLDKEGRAAFENIFRRLSILYQIAQQLQLSPEDSESFLVEAAMALSDEPFSIYRVVDLTIEKQIRAPRAAESKVPTRSGKAQTTSTPKASPEMRATIFSQRVAPLLEQIVKE